jgi:hypothetical protein
MNCLEKSCETDSAYLVFITKTYTRDINAEG